MPLPRLGSLRTRLLVFVLGTVMVATLALGTMSYRTALAQADRMFDNHMQQLAYALRAGAPLGDPSAGGSAQDGFEFLIQVWSINGDLLYESAPHAALPPLAVLGFSTVSTPAATLRLYSLQTPMLTIQVAQDLAIRRDLARRFAWAAIAPIALIAPVLLVVVFAVITAALRPLQRMRAHIAQRAADDLAALDPHDLPDEIQPLVAELNLLFERLATAFSAQQHFVANAAHELRSPLTALRLQAQAVERAASDHEREVALARLHAGIDRASRLIAQMLDLARHETTASPDPRSRVDLTALVRATTADAVSLAQARHIDLGMARADECAVSGDADALAILLRNLLDNAIRHARVHGRIDVSVDARHPDHPALIVEDDGPGIAPDQRVAVFERFHRASNDGAGSGLGLSIVKAIAERHHASVHLDTSATLGGLSVRIQF